MRDEFWTRWLGPGSCRDQAGGRDEPIVWFTSVDSFAKVLSARNRELLELIARERPGSIAELEALSGRAKSNLSRTLRTMARYGLVELKQRDRGRIVPHVPYDRITLDLPLLSPGPNQRHRAT